ncbi:hypothetical protein POPTR_015G019500v4 [Populus trichocarpa]|uniref:Angiotensin-converting enzyme 2 n=1 Tax=Populus trichocarpa TaxID=3694 RepID=A0A2K1XGQ6_POPTR|nr:hypothetical protein BDE02_15G016700 [Populus trichocarpa]KAI5561882.1 hypothetical protein BDE02_15G016700 [Populus trichocarpa]PNS99958.1 hypothetical protein POPTR_015G019500v4 [Populus trichocarpa]PNS99959.1 hypothetical protein POPTR_015G019500v4 [Populus trichocarpa]
MKFEKDPAEARLRNQQNMTPGAPGVGTGSVSIARNSRTASLCREIKIVQDLIERCLQLYMNKDEVVKTLLEQARIQPGFTSIVWNRLEQENAGFFKAYYTKLVLKKQIAQFNELLENHHNLLSYAAPLEAPLAPMQEGIQHMPGTISNYDPVYENPECGSFLSTQMNYGMWMAMDNNAADIEPNHPFMKPEIPSPVSVTSHDHFPFIPREIQESVAPSAVEFAELSHLQSVRQVPLGPGNASFNNLVEAYSGSSSTGLLDPSEQNDNVEEFFVDTFPAASSQSEEES